MYFMITFGLPDYTSGLYSIYLPVSSLRFPEHSPLALSETFPASLLIPYFFFTALQLGFVPRTLCPDGDPIDVLVLSKFPLTPGIVAWCFAKLSGWSADDERASVWTTALRLPREPVSQNAAKNLFLTQKLAFSSPTARRCM
jgi:hypothetical protein